ncbi:MAG TPA: hypothetical protein VKS60_25080 [Stellaceae bacterium]|nr:hypothetical protein [Stellaceae bacterium]
MRPASAAALTSEFDDFLFAPIGEDGMGMCLSVVSALARFDVDPWQEAEGLARLPAPTAIERLALVIGSQTQDPSAQQDPTAVAARLIALLPRRDSPNTWSRRTPPGIGAMIDSRVMLHLFICVIMAVALASRLIMASGHEPAHTDGARAAPSPEAAAQVSDTGK